MNSFFYPLLALAALFTQAMTTTVAGQTSPKTSAAKPIAPENVAVLYNNQIPESEELAKFYAKMRNIPRANLIGLELSAKDQITRAEYVETLQDPLRSLFVSRGWWKMAKTPAGQTLPGATKITTLVCVRGVPFKIKREELKEPSPTKLPAHFAKANQAAVDSELAMVGVREIPKLGPANNPYFKKDLSIADAKLPYLLLVGRIDGPSYDICHRMIGDAIATENQGLWGMCYLDIAQKGGSYKLGDNWLEAMATKNQTMGIPTVVDRNKQTFTSHYPMNEASLYFGWYTAHKNGPLLNPDFRFKRGAVAVHLHSFSASYLRNIRRHWSGPILAQGAAATVGNVYEPYLQLTHYFDILHDRLLKGYTLVEAAYMACPALSWQGVVLGDPLYRPFKHINGSGEKVTTDKNYRAIRVANQLWQTDPDTLVKKIRTSAAETGNAYFYEYLGLWHRQNKQNLVAIAFFQTSRKLHTKASDRLRQSIYIADTQREMGEKKAAIQTLKLAQQAAGQIPEKQSVTALLNILDPPPPPRAEKGKTKKTPSKK